VERNKDRMKSIQGKRMRKSCRGKSTVSKTHLLPSGQMMKIKMGFHKTDRWIEKKNVLNC